MFMDADMATELSCLPDLLSALDHSHVAVGSRAAPGAIANGMSFSRVITQKTFGLLTRSLVGLDLSDTQCGFKAFRAPAAKLLFHLSSENGWAFDVEILALAARIGYHVAEVPVRWEAVRGSHMRAVDTAAMSWSLPRIRARTSVPRVAVAVEAACNADIPEFDQAYERRGREVSSSRSLSSVPDVIDLVEEPRARARRA
jgi:hypothetical protein